MKTIFVLFALFMGTFALVDNYAHYYDHKVIQAKLTSQLQIDFIGLLDADIWSHESELIIGLNDIMVNSTQEDIIRRMGVEYEVAIPDVEEHLNNERNTLSKLATQSLASWYDTYHSFDDIRAHYESLVAAYPSLVSFNGSIGKSIQGRDIFAIKIGSSTATKKIYFEGGQHAREWIGHATVAYIAEQLLTTYATDSVTKSLVDSIQFVIVPVVNPDGYVYTWSTNRLWRKNRRANTGGSYGVDLNRNWDDHWGGEGSSAIPSSDTYRGTAAFSEPETLAVSKYYTASGPYAGAIDYHSYSQLILRPYGWTTEKPANDAVAKLVGDGIRDTIKSVHGVQYTSEASWELYYTTGTAQDWFFSKGKAPLSYTIELRDTGTYGFQLPPAQIIPTGQENWAAFKYFAQYILKN